MVQASSSEASSVQVSGPSGGKRAIGRPQQAGPHALRRLGGHEARAIDRRPDPVAISRRLRVSADRHDRDRRAVRQRRPDDVRRSVRPRDERPGTVVDEQDPVVVDVRTGPPPRPPPRPGVDRRRRRRRAPWPAATAPPTSAATRSARGGDDDPLDVRGRLERAPASRPAAGDRRRPRASLSVPPIRVELPAATTIASAIGAPLESIESRLGEDHPAGHRLEDPRDGHVDVLVDVARPALDHDHRAVIEEPDALAGLLALLDDPDPQLLARAARRA